MDSHERSPAADGFLLGHAVLLLKWRKTIVAWALGGALLGLAAGLLSRRLYVSEATFLPQAAEGNLSSLALAASRLNLSAPSNLGGWVPAVYVDLLQSDALLAPIAGDSLTVVEDGARRVAVVDLLSIDGASAAERLDRAVLALRQNVVVSRELTELGAVQIRVTTRWPSVSYAIAQRLIDEVNRFNIESRKSQATAEREFVDARTDEAQAALRDSEDRLLMFTQRNRVAGSPELTLDHDRLQRDVAMRQQLYTTLLQSREDARAREVRNTPVISVLELPRLPVLRESRRTGLKIGLGFLGGGLLALVIAYLAQGLAWARTTASADTRELIRLLDEIKPRFLRKGR